ncbi:putative quinol monooxygenase [Kitasatospora sp. NPDC056138]|uniref:putative quinol monooxygenase n=1 Tax=Kitasatospora sp. NPDC056138 TaxID=3345724 RepID=UPI0035E25CA6
MMLKLGVLGLFTAKPGKEAEVTDLLDIARGFAAEAYQTLVWYAFQIDSSPFGIFDAFADDAGRQAHLNGRIPALFAQVGAGPPRRRARRPPDRHPRGRSRIADHGAVIRRTS